jgi:hypothetical protein
MKNLIPRSIFCTLLALETLLPFAAFAGNSKRTAGKDTLTCLEVTGKVSVTDTKDKESFMVKLYEGNDAVDSMVVGMNREFKFKLRKNSNYTVKISRQGYVTRAVWIDTEIPPGVNYDPVFRFHFETALVKQASVNKKHADILDFPVALVYYDGSKGWFDYSRKYTSKIKTAISGNGSF